MKVGGDANQVFDTLREGLAAPLSGMGISFSSSLFGLAGSLVLGFLDLQMSQAQNRFFNELEEWLASLTRLSSGVLGADGEGGSIPFMGMLGERFPAAQFVVTGALGPGSNAHGPNEFLDMATARRVTACITHLLHSHATR